MIEFTCLRPDGTTHSTLRLGRDFTLGLFPQLGLPALDTFSLDTKQVEVMDAKLVILLTRYEGLFKAFEGDDSAARLREKEAQALTLRQRIHQLRCFLYDGYIQGCHLEWRPV